MAVLQLQLKLIDMGYLTEAQELEQFKAESLNTATEFYTINEKGVNQSKCFAEYEKLLKSGRKKNLRSCYTIFYLVFFLVLEPNTYVYNSKNTESLRTSIVNTTIKAITKKCIHCNELMKSIKYSYKRLMMTLSKVDMRTF